MRSILAANKIQSYMDIFHINMHLHVLEYVNGTKIMGAINQKPTLEFLLILEATSFLECHCVVIGPQINVGHIGIFFR